MNIQTTLLFVSFVATVILGLIVVPILKKKKIGQVVREEGPKSHLQKNGTPIMGGVVMLVVINAILAFFVKDNPILVLPMVATLGFGLIGFLDDFKKLYLQDPEGMSPKAKMLGLFVVTTALLVIYLVVFKLGTTTIIPLINQPITLALPVFILFIAFILLGTTNAVNLTDGLDGLAGGLAMLAYGAYGVIALLQEQWYLAGFCFVVIGALLSYIWFNVYPARFMMGDTGSFALGAGLGVVAMMTNAFFLLPIIGILFVIEAGSSLLQISSKKFFHRKIFISAPIHHHLQAKGWEESKIVMRFWIIGGVAAMLGIFLAMGGGLVG